MKRVAYILLFLLLSITTFAQRAPITVTTILTPPYTTSLSTMAESGSTRLMVNLLVNDVTITELPVKLHIKMESSGITIESIPTQAVAPMFLGGGEARVLTGDDFAQYLNLNNLNFKGFSKDAYIKNGQLPAGLWKFSVSVRHFYTNKTISNIGTVTAWITSYKPPVLTSPKEGENAPSNAALPLTFSWQASKHTGGTAAIMYRFEMWERRVEGVPAQTLVASVPPIYTTETAGRYVEIMPATLALEPGMKYCWRVTAYDPSGMVTIENNGESEVRTFQYLEKCPEVCGLTIDIKDDTGYASWEENRMHLGGYNFEFYDDEGTCYKTLWGSSTKTAGIGGEYGKTWHVRVQGICRSSVEGPWSDWVDFKIPDAFKPLKDENGNTYGCGREVPERVITNFELIDNIQKGDTLEDERGTTKYIIHSAMKNEDGSFRGLSYMKLSFWGVKVLGEYNNMKVNTDGVIIGRYAWQSVKSDLLVADPEAIEKWADELALEMAGATYNNTIKDTIVLKYSRGIVPFETIAREGTKYYAVTSDGHKEEITSFINGQKRVMVKDGDGHELVIDKDGNVMGVEEYKKCGGSKALLRESIKEKDSQVTKSGNVKFFGTGDYLFDTYDNYSGKTGYAERFPSIGEGDYRPAYACVESNTKLEIKAEPYKTYTFKNERGVPVLCKDGILEVTARGDRDTTSIYAYDAENHIVGKVNVLSYDKQTRKICLVPIGDTKAPDASNVKQGLDEIFAKLMVGFDVTIGEPITIQYAKNNIFTHGGSGVIGVYNTDQKAAISKLKERGIDNETVYLFFVNDCKALKANDSPDVVNGYMPRGYQFGFIYNELNNYRTIAHEICHGAFYLKHTFDATDYLAAECTTDNLMDYNDGKTLNHWQWKDIHQPKSVRFKWLQEEEKAEYQIVPDPACVQKFLEKFRWAFVNGQVFEYKHDSWPYAGHFANNIQLLDDVVYEKISVNVIQNLNFIPIKKNLEPNAYNAGAYLSISPVENAPLLASPQASDTKSVLKIVTDDNAQSFNTYLFPSKNVYNNQIDKLLTLLSNEQKRERVLELLSILPEQEYERISITERIRYLSLIAQNSIVTDYASSINDEQIVINLIRFIPETHIQSLFDGLESNALMYNLQNGIQGKNYTIFISEVARLFYKNKVDALNNAFRWNDYGNLELYVQNVFTLNGGLQIISTIPYYTLSNNSIYIDYREDGRIWFHNGRLLPQQRVYSNSMSPFDIIVVYFKSNYADEYVGLVEEDGYRDRVIAMPAFVLDWIDNQMTKQKSYNTIDNAVSIASFIVPLAKVAVASKLTSAAKTYFATTMIWESVDNLFSDELKSYISEKTGWDKDRINDVWQILNQIISTAVREPQNITYLIKIKNISNIEDVCVLWEAMKTAQAVKDLFTDDTSKIDSILNEFRENDR